MISVSARSSPDASWRPELVLLIPRTLESPDEQTHADSSPRSDASRLEYGCVDWFMYGSTPPYPRDALAQRSPD